MFIINTTTLSTNTYVMYVQLLQSSRRYSNKVIKRNVAAASTLFRQICYWNIVWELTVRREVRRNGVIKIWDWGWGQVTNLSDTLHYMEQHTWECISKHSDVPSIAFQSISHVMEANHRISLTCILHHTVF